MEVHAEHTEKEIMMLKDQLEVEALTVRKLIDYKASVDDPELTGILDEMIVKHKSHYERLLSHIR